MTFVVIGAWWVKFLYVSVCWYQHRSCTQERHHEGLYNVRTWFSVSISYTDQGFPFKKIFRGHCDPQVVDFGGHFQFERVTYWSLTGSTGSIIINVTWCFLRRARPRLPFVRVIAISFWFFGCRLEKRHQFWLRHFCRLVYRISIVYAQSLSLRSEELDADTAYSFVPNIGDSDPSSHCTYSKITNGADVDLNLSF